MTLTCITLIAIAAIFFAIKQYKKTSLILGFLFIFFSIAIGNGIIPAYLLKNLEYPSQDLSQYHWEKSNVIILLGAGTVKIPKTPIIKPSLTAYSRINETLRLYLSCKNTKQSCHILISGGDASATGGTEAAVYQKNLIELGVNQADILVEEKSMNTYKNAEFSSQLIKNNKFDCNVLVTSGIHLKRAQLYFSHFGIQTIPAASDYITAYISIIPLAYNFLVTDFAIHEYGGILRLYIYNFMGWNAVAVSAGAV